MTKECIERIVKRKIKWNKTPVVFIDKETFLSVGANYLHNNFHVSNSCLNGYKLQPLPHKIEQLKFSIPNEN